MILVNEEMRRVLAFCVWKKMWWLERGPVRQLYSEPLPDGVEGPPGPVLSRELAEGLMAFAAEQGDMEDRIRAAWTIKWAGVRQLARPIILAIMGEALDIPEAGGIEAATVELDIGDGEWRADDAGYDSAD